MGTSKQTTTSSNSLASWMETPLKKAFGNAQTTYDNNGSPSDYGLTEGSYNTYTPLNDTENTGLSNLASAGQNESSLGNAMSATGTTGNTSLSNLISQLRSGYGTGTTSAGTSAANSAGGYNTAAQNALNSASSLAGTNATASNIADANSYTNNATVQNMIKAATNQSNLNYNETTVPTLNADAVAGGNLNSSRAGAASAISAANQEANNQTTAANIENNAYNTGLSTAESARESNLNGLLSAASNGLSGLNTALSGQSSNNEQLNSYINNLLNASNSGVSTGTTGAQLASTGGQDTYNAGNVAQTNSTDAKQGALDAYNNYTSADWGNLKELMSILGQSNSGWGGNSTSTQKTSGSILSDIMGSIGAVGSLAKGFL